MDFSSFSLAPAITAGITACGFQAPTPIQQQTLPAALAGQDVMGLAQTGTGKTAAFVLPILQRLLSGPKGRVRALVLAPTRELAEQIAVAARELGSKTGLRTVAVYGGVSKNSQLAQLRRGVEIIVACPGRLLDHLREGAIKLDGVEVLVMDEGDQMFDMGFLPDIRRIMRYLPAKRQNMLFSATMPADIRRLAGELLVDPQEVRIACDQPAATISQALYPVEAKQKTAMLLTLLAENAENPVRSALVFTRTKHGAKKLARRLNAAGHRASDLQGNMSQNKRQAALDGFRDGTFTILVATDIAARGLDVAKVSHVINYDMPNTAEAYTHRIGRTGRAQRQGAAFSLVLQEDQTLIRAIERGLGKSIERRQLEALVPCEPDQAAPPPRGRRPGSRPDSRPASRRPGTSARPRRQGRSQSASGPRAV
ncbi:DEAD/DEAH box helicase [Desulfurivibrio dismutans]|uniref:DEAD/DEAH box helicase n=1 Tax=Desulfurivibrio dismutans TaxID=1398908 RepID=UPI0023D9E522|nr:DEAD/DEAH box helicase [Desulfurivibrio alkaliphilus]MDF1614244.1 DEAD/DEAH box helicase [Desulfurivibrio alkaliphilus]